MIASVVGPQQTQIRRRRLPPLPTGHALARAGPKETRLSQRRAKGAMPWPGSGQRRQALARAGTMETRPDQSRDKGDLAWPEPGAPASREPCGAHGKACRARAPGPTQRRATREGEKGATLERAYYAHRLLHLVRRLRVRLPRGPKLIQGPQNHLFGTPGTVPQAPYIFATTRLKGKPSPGTTPSSKQPQNSPSNLLKWYFYHFVSSG